MHMSVSALTGHTSVLEAKDWIFAFSGFSENVDFFNVPVGFGVRGGLQSMGNGFGLQMDGFSADFEPCGSIFDDFHDCGHFAAVSDGLKSPQYMGKSQYSNEKPSSLVQSPVVG